MADMNEQIIIDSLELLVRINRGCLRPRDAKARLHLLRDRYPEVAVDLLWEEESYDGSLHYDLLLNFVEEGTVSLSVCPDRALPWPLRGFHHHKESALLSTGASKEFFKKFAPESR